MVTYFPVFSYGRTSRRYQLFTTGVAANPRRSGEPLGCAADMRELKRCLRKHGRTAKALNACVETRDYPPLVAQRLPILGSGSVWER